MSFSNFIKDLKGYAPSVSDLLKIGLTSGYLSKGDATQAASQVPTEQAVKTFVKKNKFNLDSNNALAYPNDLFEPGNEAYIVFIMREGIYSGPGENIKKRMALYMPPDIKVDYGAKWGDIDLFIRSPKDQGNDIKNAYSNMFGNINENTTLEAVKTGLKATGTALGDIGRFYLKKTLKENELAQAASAVIQKTINPYAALLFENVEFRTFNFNFQLMARNKEESDTIRDIIGSFKYGMHPEVTKNTEGQPAFGGIFLDYPYVFDIYLLSPSSNYLFQIQRSALIAMNVNYNGSDVASFFKGTGAPVDVRLTLSFKETKHLTREDIENGY